MLAGLYPESQGALVCCQVHGLRIDAISQFADWMEFYAQALELNVWTSALVEKVGKDQEGQWTVTVRRGGPNGTVRILHPTHVVFATGSVGKPRVPHFEGQVRQPRYSEAKTHDSHPLRKPRKRSRERSSIHPSL